MRFRAFVAVALVLLSGGCHSPVYLEALETPALVWTQSTGLCSKIIAVDAAGTVWTHQGCEDGRPNLRDVGAASSMQVADLWVKFDALPFGETASQTSCSGRLLHTFSRWNRPSGRAASTCGGSKYDDLSGMPEAFRSMAEALRALE